MKPKRKPKTKYDKLHEKHVELQKKFDDFIAQHEAEVARLRRDRDVVIDYVSTQANSYREEVASAMNWDSKNINQAAEELGDHRLMVEIINLTFMQSLARLFIHRKWQRRITRYIKVLPSEPRYQHAQYIHRKPGK